MGAARLPARRRPKVGWPPPGNRGGFVRTVPDISAIADPFTGFAVGQLVPNQKGVLTYVESPSAGPASPTPLVAGMVAAAEQYQRPFGFLNPALYRLAGTSTYHDALPFTVEDASR